MKNGFKGKHKAGNSDGQQGSNKHLKLMISSAVADVINQLPNQNKEEKAEELLKSLLASVSGKSTNKADIGAAMPMDVNDDHETVVTVAAGKLCKVSLATTTSTKGGARSIVKAAIRNELWREMGTFIHRRTSSSLPR